MKFENSTSLTIHNVTIVTRLRSPLLPEIRKNQKKNTTQQISKITNKKNLHKSNSSSKNKNKNKVPKNENKDFNYQEKQTNESNKLSAL